MRLTERQTKIVEMAFEQDFLAVDALATMFSVTTQTIRRDLNILCDRGFARRCHGGIIYQPEISNLSFNSRQILNLKAKRIIAKEVASRIPDHSSLAISIGTTPAVVTEALLQHHELAIFTNNLSVSLTASRNDSFTVVMAGGQLRNHDLDIVGNETADFFSRYKVDIGIFGVGGVDEDGTLLDFSKDEVQARQVILANCRQSFLVLDESKFSRKPPVRGGRISDVSTVFCEQMLPFHLLELIKNSSTRFFHCQRDALL